MTDDGGVANEIVVARQDLAHPAAPDGAHLDHDPIASGPEPSHQRLHSDPANHEDADGDYVYSVHCAGPFRTSVADLNSVCIHCHVNGARDSSIVPNKIWKMSSPPRLRWLTGVGRWLHPAIGIKLLERVDHAALVLDGDHPHRASEDSHLVDGVERLRAAGHFHHGEHLGLGRPHRADRERNPVELRLQDIVDVGAVDDLVRAEFSRPIAEIN